MAIIAAASASAHVLLHKRDARAAALWVMIIWLVPGAGPALYLVAGINRMPRRAAQRGLVQLQTAVLANHVVDQGRGWLDQPLVSGNRVIPLRGGDETYAAMVEAIDAATDSVLMCTYIFDNDRAGDILIAAIQRAMGRKIEVRIIIDAMGARYSFPSVVRRLRRTGAHVALFSRTIWPWRMRYANLRNHRKVMVIDGTVGFTGGMNIREACLLSLEPKQPTLDLHARVEGPIVAELQRTLVEDWMFCTRESLSSPRFFPPLEARGEVLARAIPDGPDRVAQPIKWSKLLAIAGAKHTIRIATPYFVPDEAVLSALGVAAMKGVRVEILLPSVNNLQAVQWASMAMLWQILRHGCRVYLSPPPFDHTKLMLVDGEWATIGSANWDARSFRLNFEIDLECQSAALAAELSKIFESRRKGATELTLADVDNRSVPVRLRDGAARLLSPYL